MVLGGVCEVHGVVPPSVVAMRTGELDTPNEVPTAVQTVADAHEMPLSAVAEAGTLWSVQLLPPSVVAITVAPLSP
jgi:hypothetical protein